MKGYMKFVFGVFLLKTMIGRSQKTSHLYGSQFIEQYILQFV